MTRALTFLSLLALAVPATATSAAASPAVSAIDVWGRFTNIIELNYRMDGKQMVYAPRALVLFLVEGAEEDDVVLASWSVANKPLADVKCATTGVTRLANDKRSVVTARCELDLDQHGQKKAASFGLKLGYRQTAAGVDHKDLAEYRFDVAQHGGPAGQVEFHVDYDFRMGEAWVHQKEDGGVELFSWFKTSSGQETRVDTGKMRCKVGDKDVPMAEMTNSRANHAHDDYAKAKGGEPLKVSWDYHYFFLSGDAAGFVKDNPGEYRCVFTRNGERDRTLTFTMKDGRAVKPKCQTGESPLVKAPPSTTLIAQTFDTPQDLPFSDKAFERGALYGKAGLKAACGF